jgi:hypothetical protein
MNAQPHKGGMNAQQQQKHDRICQDAALLNKYSDGAELTGKEKKRVLPQIQKNAQQRKCRRKDSALLNKYYKDDLPVTDEEEKRVHRLDTVQIKKHWMRQNCNTRAAEEDDYYSWRKTFLHKRRQDFIASILEGEGGSTYDAVGDAAFVSVFLSWKMNMIAISLYLYLLYLKRRWKKYTCGS